ncbi:2-dehydro-3-deoxygluconokinase [Shimia sp. SK013]|uniref:carbohydrate kinase family protein n=1 Tax=Shimia sp. SK013 TaxID=1389006 RepID=UPI0006B5ACF6|nr:carbohydrate kinase [Shimia sp. SK013]KPA20744.1 2-dehydro-3-deoxygluconokinase [Shimia sp. SK013]
MILCCGEALIDMIPTAATPGQTAFVPHSGGSVFNTAIALGRLDVPTGFLSGVSTDTFGQQLCTDLAASKVSTEHLIRSENLTTLAIVHLKDGSATYSFYDENSAGRMILAEDLPPLPDDIQALYFGGISLAAEPAADTYATLLAREGQNRLVMLDPNIRPDFIKDEARYRDRLAAMFKHTDIVKTSDEDLDWLIPDQPDLNTQVEALLSKGSKVVIVTRGAEGATAFTRHGTTSVPAPSVEVRDTVGAGDTFNAGFLAGLADLGCLASDEDKLTSPDCLVGALTFGAAVAAHTVSRAGANPPWRNELS